MRKRTLSREYALQILYQNEMNPSSIEEVISIFWEDNPNITDEIRTFSENLVKGTLENLKELDAVVGRATDNWQLTRMAVIDRNILRYATYELLYCSDIPRKVTLNEAVNLAKKFSQEESGKFVNGVLDKINRTEKLRCEKDDERSRA